MVDWVSVKKEEWRKKNVGREFEFEFTGIFIRFPIGGIEEKPNGRMYKKIKRITYEPTKHITRYSYIIDLHSWINEVFDN